MDEALRARFLPRFIEAAKGRLSTLGGLLADRDSPTTPAAVRGEFHTLAGEASMLGLQELGDAARAAENAAVLWQGGDKSASLKCVRALRPLNRAVAALQASLSQPEPTQGQESRGEATVLVIDDSAINADAVVDALDEAGISAHAAFDRQGVDRALESAVPTVVLVDVYMPELPLEDVVTTARNAGVRTILLLSGLTLEELGEVSARVGADGAVSKAGGVGDVVSAVSHALRASAGDDG